MLNGKKEENKIDVSGHQGNRGRGRGGGGRGSRGGRVGGRGVCFNCGEEGH